MIILLLIFAWGHISSIVRRNPLLLSGGLIGGMLHALTGPDHLLSILPRILGQKFWKGWRVGSVWGVGHGITTSFIGSCAYLLKESIMNFEFVDILIDLNGFAIGLTLIVIGLLGLYENSQFHISMKSKDDPDDNEQMSAKDVVYFAIFLNGVFLGFSWDGLPALAPTLATTTIETVVAFLTGNFIGTVVAIALCSGLIAEASSLLSKFSSEMLVDRLSMGSSLIAALIGTFTIVTALFKSSLISIQVAFISSAFVIIFVVTATAILLNLFEGIKRCFFEASSGPSLSQSAEDVIGETINVLANV